MNTELSSDFEGPSIAIRPRVLSQLDAAKYIGVGRTKIIELVAAGEVEAKRIGCTKVVVFVDSLDAYLDRLPDARSNHGGDA